TPAGEAEVGWDAATGEIDAAGLQGIAAAGDRAGEGIATHRWTDAQKRRILDSRTQGTGLLARTLAALEPRPRVLLSGSAVGYYGDAGDEVLTESSPKGAGFLADVVEAWEAAAQPAVDAGVRTAFLRSGVVVASSGGAMARML